MIIVGENASAVVDFKNNRVIGTHKAGFAKEYTKQLKQHIRGG